MMKQRKIMLLAIALMSNLAAIACDVCVKQQPKVLRGITHGTGPQSQWDYVIIWTVAILVVLTFIYSLKFLIVPGEKSNSHIKRTILNNE